MQTVNQYIASVKRLNPAINAQVNQWPYPQQSQSHIVFFINKTGDIPANSPTVKIGSDERNRLIVLDGEQKPSQIANQF